MRLTVTVRPDNRAIYVYNELIPIIRNSKIFNGMELFFLSACLGQSKKNLSKDLNKWIWGMRYCFIQDKIDLITKLKKGRSYAKKESA